MTLRDYIEQVYPIKDRVERIRNDPRKQILESDILPCDGVVFIDGVLQKAVEVSDGYWVSVLDLLMNEAADVEKLADDDYKKAYYSYMELIDNKDAAYADIVASVKEYKNNMKKKAEMTNNV